VVGVFFKSKEAGIISCQEQRPVIGIRKSISFIVLLTLPSTLLSAADAFVGTWRLNATKSKYSGGPREIKDATLVIEEQGDSYQVIVSGTYADGSRLSVKYTVPTRGGTGQVQEGDNGMFDAVASKRVSSTERETTYMKDGKYAGTRRSVVSRRTRMTNTFKSTNAEGIPVTSVQVFEKQPY
jgi:hypothetical protein